MTHRETQQLRHIRSKRDVMALLRLTEEQYSRNVFEFAYEYLKRDKWQEEFIKLATETKAFWQWWKNEYSIADEKFLIEISEVQEIYGRDKKEIEDLYQLRHVEPGVIVEKVLVELMCQELKSKESSLH